LRRTQTEFTVETEDRRRGKRYSQTFTDNMSLKSEPKLRKLKPHTNTRRDWTKVTFKPDLERCAAALPARTVPVAGGR